MGLTEIKKELKKLDKDKLVELIADLYKKNKSVKDFFDFYMTPDEKLIFFKYKDKVFEAFYPRRGFAIKLKDAKQAISDFKKLGSSPKLLADLMLFYVETGVNLTKDFGDIDENYYNSLVKMFMQALGLMSTEDMLDKFSERTKKVFQNSGGIGWGFSDSMAQIYLDFYPDSFEEIVDETSS